MTTQGLVGHLWQLRWFNPYTEPTGPRILAEIFIPIGHCRQGAGVPPLEMKDFAAPQGYCLSCSGISHPINPKSPEALAKIRRQHLSRRIAKKAPLFTIELTEQALKTQPEYYAGSDIRAERARILADERNQFDRLTANPNILFIFGGE
jgi:hypothetical protein